MALGQKTKDYIATWNEGISGIYMAYGFVMISALISTIETCSKLKASGYSATCGFSDPSAFLTVAVSIVMFVAGLSNFFYTRRCFRDEDPRTLSGFVATFSLAIANGYMAFGLIAALNLAVSSAVSGGVSLVVFVGSTTSWMVWAILAAVIISFVMSVMAIVIQFKWSPMTIGESRSDDMPEIAADVATHAMGYGAPVTGATTEKKEKDLPPMLSADAASPVVNHGVVVGAEPTGPQEENASTTDSSLDDFGKL